MLAVLPKAAKEPIFTSVALAVFHAHTWTWDPPPLPAPTRMSGIRSAVTRAMSRETPPLKLVVAVLNG